MALTPQVRLTQTAVRSVAVGDSDLRLFQSSVRVVFNIPTQSVEVSQSLVRPVVGKNATGLRVSQSVVRVVYRGRIEDTIVRAWTFTLDGHDFYVLRLNETETLIYDTSTEQWVNWDSHGLPVWRVNCGINWIEGQSIGFESGSAILAGDDQAGILWALDPERAFDEAVLSDAPEQTVPFQRIVMGQVPMTGREVLPCYALFLIGDNFGPLTDVFTPQITLEYSDDAGKTYHDAGTIEVTPSTVNQPYEWYSLGQIEAPGRLFRLRDTGVFTRIDSLTMNDGQD
jgi:hypothetical protein